MGVDYISYGYAAAVTMGGIVGYVKAASPSGDTNCHEVYSKVRVPNWWVATPWGGRVALPEVL
ncbi:hypothetical protein E2C01_093982 [Portunus trituberculatus]|uniref:Uncharacterized protein n=1 Tax=Portunus trituberculatus TaxID=210409 RepID=A0A5B7K087_PORTR|nr:hypothetical protein [Portunus trituberculatus]